MQKSKDDVVEPTESEFPHLRRNKPGDLPILYAADKEGGAIPREVLLNFLNTMCEMMLDEGNINQNINEGKQKNMGLQDVAVHFQRDVMEYNFQIERNFGCRYLASVPEHYPGDTEVIETTQKFMFHAIRSYLNSLHQRSRRYKNGSLQPPNPHQKMSKLTIMEFLEGCNVLSESLAAVYVEIGFVVS